MSEIVSETTGLIGTQMLRDTEVKMGTRGEGGRKSTHLIRYLY